MIIESYFAELMSGAVLLGNPEQELMHTIFVNMLDPDHVGIHYATPDPYGE